MGALWHPPLEFGLFGWYGEAFLHHAPDPLFGLAKGGFVLGGEAFRLAVKEQAKALCRDEALSTDVAQDSQAAAFDVACPHEQVEVAAANGELANGLLGREPFDFRGGEETRVFGVGHPRTSLELWVPSESSEIRFES